MRRRLRHAIDWRLGAITGRLDDLARQVALLRETLDDEVRPVLRTLVAEESENRRRLTAARAAEGYDRAWSDPDPLVSVTIPTRDRPRSLLERSLPSVLAQTHANLDVIVVGDAAGPEIAEAVLAIGDPRVRWADLTQRIEAHPDPRRHWLVASGMARNEARRLARGAWLLHFDDDDALRPKAIEQLLAQARLTHAEVVYGAFEQHAPGGGLERFGAFPPAPGGFGWQGAIHHAALPFERELVAAHLRTPGDHWLLERMLRAGVRFAMVEPVVWDYYPSQLWPADRGAGGH